MTEKHSEDVVETPKPGANEAAKKRGAKRTADVRDRVKAAMIEIENDMAANEGIYPCRNGALSSAEVARRAGIHPTSFFTENLKDLGKEVKEWLNNVKREKERGSVNVSRTFSERANDWKKRYERLLQSHRDTELELQETQYQLFESRGRIDELERQVSKFKVIQANVQTEKVTRLQPKTD